ncbi:MAG: type II toxin-antitoxin system VapC family toxin [Chloroflexi bacterium]|nr:type II toxin-antitoxin system VapC family toxin [Chloroflexota bacterium]
MESIVVDSSILVASFLEHEEKHQQALEYISGLQRGDYIFHLPMLVIAEVLAAISRQPTANRLPLLARAGQSLRAWEQSEKILLYPLDRDRLELSVTITQRDRLRGADSVVAALAEELGMPLKTFDGEILTRFSQAST